ncbi:hypothetical protein GQ53DRAFT_750754, partial [Thozetella sp. PMI_491]
MPLFIYLGSLCWQGLRPWTISHCPTASSTVAPTEPLRLMEAPIPHPGFTDLPVGKSVGLAEVGLGGSDEESEELPQGCA